MMKIKIGIIIILSLIMIGCKDKKEEDVDYYPKTVYVDDRGNKVTMLNDSILIVCTCLEYPEKYKMEVINIKNKQMVINNKQLYKITLTEDWNNVYSDITLPSGDMGMIKVERIDDDKKDNDIK